MSIHRVGMASLVLLSGLLALPAAVEAQQAPGQQQPKVAPRANAAKSAPAKDTAKANESHAGDAQLRSRIEQLEEQLADMQIVIGTLESLGRGGNAGGAGGGAGARVGGGASGGGVDQARLDSLETQIRALTSQLEELSGQVRQMSGNRRSDAGSAGPFAAAPPHGGLGSERPTAGVASSGGFGSTTVTPGGHDPIGRMLGNDEPQPVSASPGLPPSAAAAGNPRELYETAYGYLLQQDYGAAEVAFEEFLRRYPTDRLAADAQYWLGETLYVQRRFKPAGQAFLRVIEKHKTSAKVPNSLLKLAQTLEQLGQKDCGIFSELETRHPTAPADVKAKARALKAKMGC